MLQHTRESGHLSLYVVERRLPNAVAADLTTVHHALLLACERFTSGGPAVRCLGSTYAPASGRLISLFEAEAAEVVRAVNRNVHVPYVSLEAAFEIDPADRPSAM